MGRWTRRIAAGVTLSRDDAEPRASGERTAQHAKTWCTGRYQHRDAQIAGSLFVGTLLIYAAVSRHKYVAYDAASMVGLAHTLVNHLSLNAGQDLMTTFI